MVSQDIVNYLKEGQRRGFTIDRLKKELLNNGFDQNAVNEAAGLVQRPVQKVPQQVARPVQQQQQPVNQPVEAPKKGKTGIVIFLTFILILLIGVAVAVWIYKDKILGLIG